MPGGKPLTVRTPIGVKDGQKIRLAGKGKTSPNGGEPGDVILTVHVSPHPVFTRDGDNLRMELPISFDEAALGAEVKVPTLGGMPVKVKVAPGTPRRTPARAGQRCEDEEGLRRSAGDSRDRGAEESVQGSQAGSRVVQGRHRR